jgi:hypothetical protein
MFSGKRILLTMALVASMNFAAVLSASAADTPVEIPSVEQMKALYLQNDKEVLVSAMVTHHFNVQAEGVDENGNYGICVRMAWLHTDNLGVLRKGLEEAGWQVKDNCNQKSFLESDRGWLLQPSANWKESGHGQDPAGGDKGYIPSVQAVFSAQNADLTKEVQQKLLYESTSAPGEYLSIQVGDVFPVVVQQVQAAAAQKGWIVQIALPGTRADVTDVPDVQFRFRRP